MEGGEDDIWKIQVSFRGWWNFSTIVLHIKKLTLVQLCEHMKILICTRLNEWIISYISYISIMLTTEIILLYFMFFYLINGLTTCNTKINTYCQRTSLWITGRLIFSMVKWLNNFCKLSLYHVKFINNIRLTWDTVIPILGIYFNFSLTHWLFRSV